jgi:hypothetical protein
MLNWLTRKRRNRRSSDCDQTLDVKLRTSHSRAARWRLLGRGAIVLFSLAVVGLVLWRGGKWMLNGLIYQNDAFAIQQIQTQTDGVLTAETIRSWARVRIGENLMALNLMRVKRDLELQPPIESVAVERVLPHTLKLTVTEREPVAQTVFTVARPGGAPAQVIYEFDRYGYSMKPLDPRWRTEQPPAGQRLPVLAGVAPAEAQPGRQTSSPQIRAALEMLCDFDHSPMTGMVEIERVDVSQPQVLLVTTSQKAQITFSTGNFDTQFRHWRLIRDQFLQWGKAIASLDLSISNNLPVHWVAASSLPPVAPAPPKPLPQKRKHV